MSAWAKPGVKCVCISDDWHPSGLNIANVSRVPMLKEILTVQEVTAFDDGLSLQFREISSISANGTDIFVVWWSASHFRPLTSDNLDQDLALFTPILDGLPIREDA